MNRSAMALPDNGELNTGGRQGAAAKCGGKVPLPGAHANAPTGGVRAAGTGKAAVGRQSH